MHVCAGGGAKQSVCWQDNRSIAAELNGGCDVNHEPACDGRAGKGGMAVP
jgi:hypothetical protein